MWPPTNVGAVQTGHANPSAGSALALTLQGHGPARQVVGVASSQQPRSRGRGARQRGQPRAFCSALPPVPRGEFPRAPPSWQAQGAVLRIAGGESCGAAPLRAEKQSSDGGAAAPPGGSEEEGEREREWERGTRPAGPSSAPGSVSAPAGRRFPTGQPLGFEDGPDSDGSWGQRASGPSMQATLLQRFDLGTAMRDLSIRVLFPFWIRVVQGVRAQAQLLTRTWHRDQDQHQEQQQGLVGRQQQGGAMSTVAHGTAIWPLLLGLALPAAAAGMAEPAALLVETRLLARSGDALGLEMAAVALPALLALAADPLASLTDTYFVAQIGAVQLAAVGVAVSVFNLVSKVLNFPLLNITTSFVAAEQEAKLAQASPDSSGKPAVRAASPAVSAALCLGAGLGIVEAGLLMGCASGVIQLMGVSPGSAMLDPAAHYLTLRALGAPAVVVALAAQGVFRGFKDTSTPLVATVISNGINVFLDPVLMFACHLGVEGAALATVLAQYGMAGYLLWRLNSSVDLLPPKLSELRFDKFLTSGGLLFGRTLALLLTVTLATSMAARQGPEPMAAHQICSQTWLAASLLADSVALAAQTLLASAFARNDLDSIQRITTRSLQMGAAMGLGLSVLLAVALPFLPYAFTSDPGVLAEMNVILPAVVLLQPVTALAFVFDGLHYGASDFSYAAKAMMLLVLPAIPVLLLAPPVLGLRGVWLGLALITASRVAAGFFRLGSRSGPWAILDAASVAPSVALDSATPLLSKDSLLTPSEEDTRL